MDKLRELAARQLSMAVFFRFFSDLKRSYFLANFDGEHIVERTAKILVINQTP